MKDSTDFIDSNDFNDSHYSNGADMADADVPAPVLVPICTGLL